MYYSNCFDPEKLNLRLGRGYIILSVKDMCILTKEMDSNYSRKRHVFWDLGFVYVGVRHTIIFTETENRTF